MSFKAICLCLLIVILGFFIYIKVQILGSDNSAFNQTTRYELGKYEFLRSIFSLHKDGDARAEYLLGSTPIDIEVAQSPADQLPDYVVNNFAAQVTAATGRPTNVYEVDGVPANTLTDAQIAQVVKTDRRQFNTNDPVLLVIYADDFVTTTQEVAKTVEEFSMVLSNAQLQSLTAGYPAALPQYQESTMLHEFGHQLGLDHNTQPDCIMNPDIENATAPATMFSNYTPTAFCQYELDQLNQIKSSLH